MSGSQQVSKSSCKITWGVVMLQAVDWKSNQVADEKENRPSPSSSLSVSEPIVPALDVTPCMKPTPCTKPIRRHVLPMPKETLTLLNLFEWKRVLSSAFAMTAGWGLISLLGWLLADASFVSGEIPKS